MTLWVSFFVIQRDLSSDADNFSPDLNSFIGADLAAAETPYAFTIRKVNIINKILVRAYGIYRANLVAAAAADATQTDQTGHRLRRILQGLRGTGGGATAATCATVRIEHGADPDQPFQCPRQQTEAQGAWGGRFAEKRDIPISGRLKMAKTGHPGNGNAKSFAQGRIQRHGIG